MGNITEDLIALAHAQAQNIGLQQENVARQIANKFAPQMNEMKMRTAEKQLPNIEAQTQLRRAQTTKVPAEIQHLLAQAMLSQQSAKYMPQEVGIKQENADTSRGNLELDRSRYSPDRLALADKDTASKIKARDAKDASLIGVPEVEKLNRFAASHKQQAQDYRESGEEDLAQEEEQKVDELKSRIDRLTTDSKIRLRLQQFDTVLDTMNQPDIDKIAKRYSGAKGYAQWAFDKEEVQRGKSIPELIEFNNFQNVTAPQLLADIRNNMGDSVSDKQLRILEGMVHAIKVTNSAPEAIAQWEALKKNIVVTRNALAKNFRKPIDKTPVKYEEKRSENLPTPEQARAILEQRTKQNG